MFEKYQTAILGPSSSDSVAIFEDKFRSENGRNTGLRNYIEILIYSVFLSFHILYRYEDIVLHGKNCENVAIVLHKRYIL